MADNVATIPQARMFSFALDILKGSGGITVQNDGVTVDNLRLELISLLTNLRETVSTTAPVLVVALGCLRNAYTNLDEGNSEEALVQFGEAGRFASSNIGSCFDGMLVGTRIQLLCVLYRMNYFTEHGDMSMLGKDVQKVFENLISHSDVKNAVIDATTTIGGFNTNKSTKMSKRTKKMLYTMTQVLNLRAFLTSVLGRTFDIPMRDKKVLNVVRDMKLVPVVGPTCGDMISVLCILLVEDKLYVSDERNILTVFDTSMMDIVHTIHCTHQAQFMVYAHTTNRLYTTNTVDNVITAYDTLTYTELSSFVCNTRLLHGICVSSDRIFVAGGSRQGVIYVWDQAAHTALPSLEGGVDFVYALHVCGDVLYSGWEGRVLAHNITSVVVGASTVDSGASTGTSGAIVGQMTCSLRGMVHTVTNLVKCNHMLCASRGMYIDVFDVSAITNNTTTTTTSTNTTGITCPLLYTMTGHTTIITSLHMQNHLLYSSSLDSTIKVWDLNTTALVNTLLQSGPDTGIQCMAVQDCRVYAASYGLVIAFVDF